MGWYDLSMIIQKHDKNIWADNTGKQLCDAEIQKIMCNGV
jgi:hypothetical protein